jgi:hypothetical protein
VLSSAEEELSPEEEELSSEEDVDSSIEAAESSIEAAESSLTSTGADSSTLIKDSAESAAETLVYASEEEALLLSPLQAAMETDRASMRQQIINFFMGYFLPKPFCSQRDRKGSICVIGWRIRIEQHTNEV